MQIHEQDFIKYLTIKKKLSGNSIRTYAGRFSIIQRWLKKNEVELNRQSVEDFLYEKKHKEKLSNAAVNTYIHTLNHLDSYCKDRNLSYGFMEGTEGLPKEQSEINPLTPVEIDRLLSVKLQYKNRNGVSCVNLDLKYLTLTHFIAITGCRFEEAASLKVKRLDIENERALLVNTKNKHNRYVFFNGEIKNSLRQLISDKDDEDLVFSNSKGQHMHPGDFNNNLRSRAKLAGITKRVHAHLLRHSYATQLYKKTHDITLVATILGHKDIKTTNDTYVHLDTEYLQKAVQRHPLMRKNVSPIEVLKDLRESLQSFNLDIDDRFRFSISESNNRLVVEVEIK